MKETIEKKVARLESALSQLEEERAIRNLVTRYAASTDVDLTDEYMSLWTTDCVQELEFQGKVLRWVGKTELKKWRDGLTVVKTGKPNTRMHFQGNNFACSIKGNNAEANSYTFVMADEGGKIYLTSEGAVLWRFKKVNGKWLIKDRIQRQMDSSELKKVLKPIP